MKVKKVVSVMLVTIFAMCALTGCVQMDQAEQAEQAEETEVTEETGSKKSTGEVTKLQLAHQMANTHSIHESVEKLAELVKEKSGGSMEIEIFPAAALGSERENLEALSTGVLDMAIIAVEFYPAYVEEAGVFVLPYVYDDYNHQKNVYNGEAGQMLADLILEETNVKVLGYYIQAFRQLFTQTPVETVEDIKGLKIRVPESATYVTTFNMLGAASTPVAWGETYTALETSVVDGLENTPEGVYSSSLHEVTQYMNLTDHISGATTFSISNQAYEKLTQDEQDILNESIAEVIEFAFNLTLKNDDKFRQLLKEELEVVETDKTTMRNTIDYNEFDVMKSDNGKTIMELIDKVR